VVRWGKKRVAWDGTGGSRSPDAEERFVVKLHLGQVGRYLCKRCREERASLVDMFARRTKGKGGDVGVKGRAKRGEATVSFSS